MRYRKISPKNDKWTKTCEALKQLFETLRCSKCKSSLHDKQQFLECGHFTCFSCIKNSNKCIECHFAVNDDVLKDETIKKIVQACCIIAEQVRFKELPHNNGAMSNESPVRDSNSSNNELNSLDPLPNKVDEDSKQSAKGPGNGLKRRRGIQKLAQMVTKKAKVEKMIPNFRIPKNVDKKNHVGETKMQQECKRGHVDNVKALLDAGANPNTSCAAGWTPLQECADYGYIEIAKLLLKKGANINQKGFQGRTPLHEAILAGQFAMVKFLLDNKAQKDIEDDDDNKPIYYCKLESIKELMKCDEGSGSPSTSKRARSNNLPLNKVCDNISGVPHNSLKESHNVSAVDDMKVENGCDSSNSDSEDDGAPYKERCSPNITISHEESNQTSPEIINELFDTEEIDILN